jgi:ABC-2 type transport system permease protein/sodium transport system permease protein
MNFAPAPPASRTRPGVVQGLARIGRLARKELSEILRDRRTILTLVLMPLLLYPLLSFAFRQFLPALLPLRDEDRPLAIGVARPTAAEERERERDREAAQRERRPVRPRSQKELVEAMLARARQPQPAQAAAGVGLRAFGGGPREPLLNLPLRFHPAAAGGKPPAEVQIVEVDDLQAAFTQDEIDVQLLVHPAPFDDTIGDWVLVYLETSPRGRDLADYLEEHINLAGARRAQEELRALHLRADLTPARVLRSVIPPVVSSASALSLTAVVPLILILMTITGAVYPAIDLTAGERERGTLEILVSAPVPRLALLLAKYVAVVTVAMLTATINLGMMLATLELNELTPLVFPDGITAALVVQLFFLLMLFAAFFSAVLLALTSFARSFKEAQAYLVPLMLVSLAPGVMGMIPGLGLAGPLAVTPLVNIVLLARDLAEGHANLTVAMVVVVSTLVYAAVAVALAARIFGAEAVLYSEQSSWSDLLRRPAEPRRSADVAGALLCLALALPGLFLLVGVQPYIAEEYRLAFQVFSSAVLFVALPLAACALRHIRPSSALQLGLPPWAAWPAALLLAFAAVPVVYFVYYWMHALGLTLLTPEQEQAVRQLVRSWRGQEPWPYVVTFALIGVLEELTFRGFLFSALRAVAGQWTTVLVSALLFALFHFVTQFDRLVPSLLMGMLLGWVAWQTRSVLPGMLLHAAYNATYLWLAFVQTGARTSRLDYEVPLWWQLAAVPVGLVAAATLWWFRVGVEANHRDTETPRRQNTVSQGNLSL